MNGIRLQSRNRPGWGALVVIAVVATCLEAQVRAADGEPAVPSAEAAQPHRAPARKPPIRQIQVYFKLDARLTRGLYMGDRWVSPAKFTGARQPGSSGIVQARAVGLDRRGRVLDRWFQPEWRSDDPDVVTVSPDRGNTVTITSQRPGQSKLQVMFGDTSTTLLVTVAYDAEHDTTQLLISQSPAGPEPVQAAR